MKKRMSIISWAVCISMLLGILSQTASAQFSTGDIPGGGQVWSSAVYGSYGYAVVGNGSANGLYIINNINTSTIAFGEKINGDGIATDRRNTYVAGDYLFYGSNDRLYRYKISETPGAPVVVAQYDAYKPVNYMTSRTINGTEYVYACYNNGVAVFDMSKPEDAAPVNLPLGKATVAGFSDTHIYVYADNKITSYKITYGDTIAAEKMGEQMLSGEHAIGDPGTAVYVDGYVCISGKSGSAGSEYGGSILMVDAELLDRGELSTYRYYSRGSQAEQKAANMQMVAMDVYNGLLLVVERCHGAPPSMAFMLDISEPDNPVRVWEKAVLGGPVGVFISNDVMYLSARDAAYQAVPVDLGAYCKITNIKSGAEITAFPFTIEGIAVNAETVALSIGGVPAEAPVAADGSWSYTVHYCENGPLMLGASVGVYSSEKEININVPAALTLVSTLAQDGVPQEALVGGAVTLDVTAVNNTDAELNAMLYAVLYQGDDIVSLERTPLTIAAGADQAAITGKAYNVSSAALADSVLKVFAVSAEGDVILLSNVCAYVPAGYVPPVTEQTAAGSADINIRIEPDHTAVQAEILGTLPGEPQKNVLLAVYKPGADSLDGIDYINVVRTNDKGSFLVRYSLGVPAVEEQDYRVQAAARGMDGVWCFNGKTDTFRYYGPSYQQRALQAVNDAAAAAVIETIAEYNLVYGIELDAGSAYALLGKDSFYQENVRKALAEQAFQAVSEVKPYFTKMVATQQLLKAINEGQEVAAVKTLIEQAENAALLGVDSGYLYGDLEEARQMEVVKAVMESRNKAPYQTVEAFLKQYEELCALSYVDNASYTNMGDALRAANKTLQLDLAGSYATLANVENQLIYVHKVLDRTTFETVEALRAVFQKAVQTAEYNKNSYRGDNGSGSSGGGRGSGGGGGVISVLPGPDVKVEPPEPIQEEKTEQTVQFTDLQDTHWAKPHIDRLAKAGVVSGYSDGSIKPDAAITRAEFIKLLVDAYKLEDENYVSSFNDVQKNGKFYDWYYNSVATAQALGLVAGDENGNFNPNACITRQDMAVILYKMYQKQEIAVTGAAASYVDAAEVAAYAAESVNAVTELGIMSGVGGDTFAPQANVTRAMAFTAVAFSLELQ